MEKRRVFLDTSVVITALLSEKGASFHLLMNYHEEYQFFINKYVVHELLDVVERKFPDRADFQSKFFLLLGIAGVEVLALPKNSDLIVLEELVEKEDTPILASALEHCEYLLTLDRGFLAEEVLKFAHENNLTIKKPGEFLKDLRNAI